MSVISKILDIDDYVTSKINPNSNNIYLKRIFKILTNIGQAQIWIVIALIFLVFSMEIYSIQILNNFWVGALITLPIKYFTDRKRPFQRLKVEPGEQLYGASKRGNSSLPSWHSMNATMMVITIVDIFPIFIYIAIILIVITGFSRIFLRMHYLSDVVLGIFLGIICTPISRFLAIIFISL
ncbi:MAG: phosphatase PAP2 family protein [archaeon]|nr:phosphatase PAP2 family protein [archaeon]